MLLRQPTLPLLIRICREMREADRAEITATRWGGAPADIALSVFDAGALSWVAMTDDGQEPVAAWGAVECWPGYWSVWLFATPRWREVAWGVGRHIRRRLVPILIERGGRRAECRCLAANTTSIRWLQSLGAEIVCKLPGFGKHGEDFCLMAWRRENVLRTLRGQNARHQQAAAAE